MLKGLRAEGEFCLISERGVLRWRALVVGRGGKTQLIWDFCAFLRKDGFFDNLVGRYLVKTLNRYVGGGFLPPLTGLVAVGAMVPHG